MLTHEKILFDRGSLSAAAVAKMGTHSVSGARHKRHPPFRVTRFTVSSFMLIHLSRIGNNFGCPVACWLRRSLNETKLARQCGLILGTQLIVSTTGSHVSSSFVSLTRKKKTLFLYGKMFVVTFHTVYGCTRALVKFRLWLKCMRKVLVRVSVGAVHSHTYARARYVFIRTLH